MSELSDMKIKLMKKKDKFIREHEFKSADELSFSHCELTDLVKQNKIISIELSGKKMFPIFQFNVDAKVYEVLQTHLPRLLCSGRSGWDICFWLNSEHAVVLKRLKPDASQLEGKSLDEVLRIAEKAAGLRETCIARPIDIAAAGDQDTFTAFVEDLLNPDYRIIPEPMIPEDS